MRETQERIRDREGLCGTLGEIAELQRAAQKPQLALSTRTEQLAVAVDMGSLGFEAEALAQLAKLYVDRGDYAKALDHADRSIQQLRLAFDSLPPRQAALARHRTADASAVGLAASLGLAAEDPAALAAVCRHLEAERSAVLLTQVEGRRAIGRAKVSPELLERQDEARAAEAIARAELQAAHENGNLQKQRDARARMEAEQSKRIKAIDSIHLERGLAADLLYPEPAAIEAIQGALRPDEAMVLYGTNAGETIALVLTTTRRELRELGPWDAVAAACAKAAEDPKHPEQTQRFEALGKLLATPLKLDTSIRRVLVSPKGMLSYQPFSMLFQDREVTHVSSGTIYAHLNKRTPIESGDVLAFGDPDYAKSEKGTTVVSEYRGRRLRSLPGSAEEARRVGTVVRLRGEANETRVRADIAKHAPLRGLHFAAHGLVDEHRLSRSAVALTPTEGEDGRLFAYELNLMDVAADLVVVSACASGRAGFAQAEGIVGLTMAFFVAGARRVIVSSWSVDDEATRELMIKFHELWNHENPEERLSAGAALKAAQEHVKAQPKWSHPQFWGAWQLWGPAD